MPRHPQFLEVDGALVAELRAQDFTNHHGLGDARAVLLFHALLELGVRGEAVGLVSGGCVDKEVELGCVPQEDVRFGNLRIACDAGRARAVVTRRADEPQYRGEQGIVDWVAGVEGDVVCEMWEVGLRQREGKEEEEEEKERRGVV